MKRLPYRASPCKDCPFRKDCLPEWLGAARIKEILAAQSFICHKTTKRSQERLQCAGHMLLKGDANIFVRVAGNMKINIKITGRDLVFDNEQSCIKHHSHHGQGNVLENQKDDD